MKMDFRKMGMVAAFWLSLLAGVSFAALASSDIQTNSEADFGVDVNSYASLGDQGQQLLSAAVVQSPVKGFGLSGILAAIVFGGIGFVAFIYGKKNSLWRTMFIGIGLMAYPYFFAGTILTWLIGIVLTAALFLWRE
jgi:hypothetical protein